MLPETKNQFSFTRAASNLWSRLSALGSNTLRPHVALSCVLVALCLAVPATLYAQKLEDFKNAASKEGVESIPFDDLRSTARDLEKAKEERKEPALKVPEFESFKKRKENLFDRIKKLRNETDAELDFLARYNTDPDFPSDNMVNEVRQCMKKCDEIEKDFIAKINDQMTKGADACDQFAEARANLRKCFDSVKEKLSDAKSNPGTYLGSDASEDDKKQLSDYIDKIKAGIESREEEHRKQEDGNRQKAQDLRALISRTE